jgi:TonB family protein
LKSRFCIVVSSLLCAAITVAAANASERLVLPSGHVCSAVQYPEAALKAKAEGTTVLLYEVRSDGSISRSMVRASAGKTREHKMLDRVVATMISSSCRLPAGQEVKEGAFSLEYNWRLPQEQQTQ